MDYLWKNCGESQESLQLQHETSDFIRIKEEELKAISEHFENLNKMDIDKMDGSNSQKNAIEGKADEKNQNGGSASNQNSKAGSRNSQNT
jgi:hypothetical protein